MGKTMPSHRYFGQSNVDSGGNCAYELILDGSSSARTRTSGPMVEVHGSSIVWAFRAK